MYLRNVILSSVWCHLAKYTYYWASVLRAIHVVQAWVPLLGGSSGRVSGTSVPEDRDALEGLFESGPKSLQARVRWNCVRPLLLFFFLGCKRVFLQVGSSEPKVELTWAWNSNVWVKCSRVTGWWSGLWTWGEKRKQVGTCVYLSRVWVRFKEEEASKESIFYWFMFFFSPGWDRALTCTLAYSRPYRVGQVSSRCLGLRALLLLLWTPPSMFGNICDNIRDLSGSHDVTEKSRNQPDLWPVWRRLYTALDGETLQTLSSTMIII